MSFSHDTSWEIFENILAKQLPTIESWNKFIDEHERDNPAPYWDKLRELHSSKEQDEIAEWLNNLVGVNSIPETVQALWVGIAMLWDEENEKEFYAYYIQGADNFEENEIEWATDPIYDPEGKYFVPEVLNQLRAAIKKESEDFEFLDWILPIAYSSFLFDEIIREKLSKEPFLKHRNKLFVSIGFEGGDFKELTPIEKD
jgi:hypothetical protein